MVIGFTPIRFDVSGDRITEISEGRRLRIRLRLRKFQPLPNPANEGSAHLKLSLILLQVNAEVAHLRVD